MSTIETVINNRRINIPVTSIDAEDDIRIKIASAVNTLPKYLNKYNSDYSNITDLKYILSTGDIDNPYDFWEENKENYEISLQEFLYAWIAYTEYPENLRLIYLNNFEYDLERFDKYNTLPISVGNMISLFNNKDDRNGVIYKWVKDNQQKIINNQQKIRQSLGMIQYLEELAPVPITEFQIEKRFVTIIIDESNMKLSLLYLFDNINLNQRIPFVNYKDTYKVYKDFIPNDEWIEDVYEEKINMYMNFNFDTETDDFVIIEMYRDVNDKLIIQIGILEEDIILNDIKDVVLDVLNLPDRVSSSNVDLNKVTGYFFAPGQRINIPLFTDMIMNQDLVKKFFVSNENIISTSRGTRERNVVYTQFTNPLDKTLILSTFSPKFMEKFDYQLKDIGSENINRGEHYVKIRINRASNIDAIQQFRILTGKIFSIYNSINDNYVNFYKRYIPSFDPYPTLELEDNELKLKEIAPEIFRPFYSKQCTKVRLPSIVPEEEGNNYDENRKVIFPKTTDEGIQRIYTCKNDDYPYIGVIKSSLDNKDDIPFIPCCFQNDQTEIKEGSTKTQYYNYYLKPETEKEQQNKKNIRLIVTKKFATLDIYGVLPDNIKDLFFINDKKNNYYRKGVGTGANSFLETVLDGINYNGFSTIKDVDQRRNIVLEQRQILSQYDNLSICKQECFDMSEDEIRSILETPTTFLSPLYFIRLLETIYNVRIIIFGRDEKTNPDGNIIIPRHTNGYVFTPVPIDSVTLFVYMHTGGIWENYESVELIVRTTPSKETIYSFSSTDNVVENIYRTQYALYTYYQQQEPINTRMVPFKNNIVGQYIDMYGKLRMVIYDNGIKMFCEPSSPLNVQVVEKSFTINPTRTVIQFLEEWEGHVKQNQFIDEESNFAVLEVRFRDSNFVFIIDNDIPGVDYTSTPIISLSKSDILGDFIRNERYVRQLNQYIMYLFSKGEYKDTTADITKFISERIKFDENSDYDLFAIILDDNDSNVIINNKKLLRDVIYNLRLVLFNTPSYISSYKNEDFMRQYYLSINDYKKRREETIVSGIENMKRWINIDMSVILYNYVKEFVDTPYYIRYNKRNYIAQRADGMLQAISIIRTWYIDGYNAGTEQEVFDIDIPEHTIVPFRNKTFIDPVYVEGVSSRYEYLIFVNKEIDELVYTAALPI